MLVYPVIEPQEKDNDIIFESLSSSVFEFPDPVPDPILDTRPETFSIVKNNMFLHFTLGFAFSTANQWFSNYKE